MWHALCCWSGVWDIGKQVTYPENDYSITVSVSVNACLHASTYLQWLCVCFWGGGNLTGRIKPQEGLH